VKKAQVVQEGSRVNMQLDENGDTEARLIIREGGMHPITFSTVI